MQPERCQIVFRIFTFAALALAPASQADAQRRPLARIGDRAIYEEELLPSIGAQLHQLKNQEYELRMTALQNLVNQRLLEEEAKGTGLSIQQFLLERVDRLVPPPDSGEIEAYYLEHKDPLSRQLEEIKAQLERTVSGIKLRQARKDYFEALQRKAGVSILFSQPRVNVSPDPVRTRGNPDAPVTIIEFADFECPASQKMEPTLAQILDRYEGKVRIAFLDFPLKAIHPMAARAAEATRCAGEQRKFWEYHDLLLSKEDARLDPDGLGEHARNIGLELERFGTCLESRRFAAAVANDTLDGYRSGVSATPTFFVNGIQLVGIQPASALSKIIDSELL